jgi:hypothetical protein
MTFGWFRQRVLLPATALEWSEDRLHLVLGHELAHVARRDFQVLLGIQVMCAFYWFNPLIWMARRHLVREREMACDDQVLCRGAVASDYADHLLAIASHRPALAGVAGLCISRLSELEGRLLAILKAGSRRVAPSPAEWGRLSLLMAALVLPLAGFSPWRRVALDALPHGEIQLSAADREELARLGISDAYVNAMAAVGYRDLTPEQVARLFEVIPDQRDLKKMIENGRVPLTEVADVSHVCMRADQVIGRTVIAVEIEGLRYYAMASCTTVLLSKPTQRLAVDPYSGRAVSKARAVLAATPDGKNVYYFENRQNLDRYNHSLGLEGAEY